MTPDTSHFLRNPGHTVQPSVWPHAPVHSETDFLDIWHRVFGAGLRRRVIETIGSDAARLELVCNFARRRASLGTRFVFCPADQPFVTQAERRLIPLRQLSCPISLEAGNLRGNLQIAAGADPQRAITGLAHAITLQSGWDYLTLPVPESEIALWQKAATTVTMPLIVRRTGRVFHTCLSARQGWTRLRENASRNDRKNEAKALRRADEAGVSITIHTGADALAALPMLRAVANHSTKTARLSDAPVQVPYTLRQERFLTALMQLPKITGVLLVIEGPDGPLAASLWLRRGHSLLGTVTFHTEAARALSPGLLLMREAFLWAAAHGITTLDFNATDSLYASYSDATEAWCDLLLFPAGLKGRLLHTLAASRDQGTALMAGGLA